MNEEKEKSLQNPTGWNSGNVLRALAQYGKENPRSSEEISKLRSDFLLAAREYYSRFFRRNQ